MELEYRAKREMENRVKELMEGVYPIITPFTVYDPEELQEYSAIYMGDMIMDRPVKDMDPILYQVNLATGSDYSGGALEQGNHKWFLDQPQEGIYRLYGGYDSYGIALTREAVEYFIDELEGLMDYPAIDDEYMSEVEMRWEEEAWPDVIRDVRYDLEKLGVEEAVLDTWTEEALIVACQEVVAEGGVYWSYEHASAWIDPEELAKQLIARDYIK